MLFYDCKKNLLLFTIRDFPTEGMQRAIETYHSRSLGKQKSDYVMLKSHAQVQEGR